MASAQRRSPYRGLIPYTEEDSEYFFGREKEARLITANLFAAPLTLLYGASGVGKTSVLRAGVVGGLRQREDLVVIYFNAWQTEPTAHLKNETLAEIERATGEGITLSKEMPLSDFLTRCSNQLGRHLMVILDQFEEYFLYHPQEDSFAEEFPLALTEMLAPVSFLISLREDALARLDRFKGRIPTLFDNILRVDHLEEIAARAAIERPVEKYNALELEEGEPPVEIEPALVETIITKLQAGQVVLGEAGRGGIKSSSGTPAGRRVETPYLQLVMERLWREELVGGSPLLRLETLERLGGPERIVRTHLDTILGELPAVEQDHAASIFHFLVTPGGTKIAHTAPDLANYSDLPQSGLVSLLERLAHPTVRILRTVAPPPGQPALPRYEIFHDVLAPAILDWRTRFMSKKEIVEAEEAARQEGLAKAAEERAAARQREREQAQRLASARLLTIIIAIALVFVTIMSLVAFVGFRNASIAEEAANDQRAMAEEQANIASTQGAIAEEQANIASTQETIALEYAAEAERQKLVAEGDRDIAATALVEADNQRQIAQVGELSAQALMLMEDHHDLAVLLGIEAFTTEQSLQNRRVLYAVWKHNPQLLRILWGHTSLVSSVAFSPDGRMLATGSAFPDNSIRLWDLDVGSGTFGEPLGEPLTGHTDGVFSVAFSPDGAMLASGSADATVLLWDVEVGSPMFGQQLGEPLTGHTDRVNSVAFSPDEAMLASGSSDNTIRLWGLEVGSPTFGEQLGEPLTGHTGLVRSVAFSPDGATLASGSDDATVRLWDVDVGSPTFGRPLGEPLTGHTFEVLSVAFSPDGATLVSGSWRTIRLWDVEVGSGTFGGPLREPLTGHNDYVWSVVFSPDGATLASGSQDNTIRLWDVDVGSPTFGEPLGEPLTGHTDWVSSVAFSPDGETLASGSADDTVRLWDVDDSSPNFRGLLGVPLAGHTNGVLSVAFSPDGATLASGSEFPENTIRLWDVQTGVQLNEPLTGHTDMVWSVAFSPDGETLASGSFDNTIRLWDVEVGSPTFGEPLGEPLTGHTDWVFSVAFSPDGATLASGSGDDTVRLWDVEVGSPTFGQPLGEPLTGHTDAVQSVTFNPDGTTLASGSRDGTVRLWDEEVGSPTFGEQLGEPLTGHTLWVNSMAFSPDGFRLASGSLDNTIRLWDVEVGSPTFGRPLGEPLTGHSGQIRSVAFSPDGAMLASGSSDATVRLWNVDVGSPTFGGPLGEPLTGHADWVWSVAFSPDGATLASGSSDATIRLWDMDPALWIQSSCQRAGRNLTEAEWNQYLSWKGPFDPEYRTCPKRSVHRSVIIFLFEDAFSMASEGDIDGAVEKLQQALELDPTLDIDPDVEPRKWYALILIEEGSQLALDGQTEEAIAKYKEAQTNYSEFEISASTWNTLCWYGSLWKHAADVLFACEKAVELSPNEGFILDSRGLARALTGDYDGAIADFKFYVDWAKENGLDESYVLKREGWIASLEANINPFDDETLEALKSE